jgi:hypothetical protein
MFVQEDLAFMHSKAAIDGSFGRLTLIGLGDVGDKYMQQLTQYYATWSNQNSNPVMPNWKEFFLKTAYDCGGEVNRVDLCLKI